MSFVMAYYPVMFLVILITHETIFPVNGQCTVQGCDNGDQLFGILAEIHQLRVDLFDQLNKGLRELNASIQEMKGQHGVVVTSLQVVQKVLNTSFEEMKSDHTTVRNMSFQAVDRCLQEREVHIKQGQSIHELLNESFQEMKGQHGTVMTSLQIVHKVLNTSFEEIKSQLDTLNMSFQAVNRCTLEEDICREQFQNMHTVFNESVQEIKSQHGVIMTSLQGVYRRLEEHDISTRNQTQNSLEEHDISTKNQTQNSLEEHDISIRSQTQNEWNFTNGYCDPASEVCDCSDIKASGQNQSGVYEVCVGHQLNRTCTSAFCDMETANGASLVFQRRNDGSVNFNRTWAEYRAGFGNPDGEFYLGNEMLYLLTSKRAYKLRVDLEDWEGEKRYAEYSTFSINSPTNNYRLKVGGYSGNVGDGLGYNHDKQFTTIDRDNDEYGDNCARRFSGGWWYGGGCFMANLNGIYLQRYDTVSLGMGIQWYYWRNSWTYSLKAAEMRLVPVA